MWILSTITCAVSWLRRYAVFFLLVGTFSFSMIKLVTVGIGPIPQQPPNGYEMERASAILQWDKGTRLTPIALQVSIDDPDFKKPLFDKVTTGTTHNLSQLERGKTYYWRLVQDEKSSPTNSFKVSTTNVNL